MKEKLMKTRFSPSPSGSLHIGGARTALYNWLLAKKHNGIFLVRVEDTDQKRSSDASENTILDSLRWLGLDWQQGIGVSNDVPYRQSERKDIYKHYAEQLIKEGKAYRCYCTPEELDRQRKEIEANNPKSVFKYPRTCIDKGYDRTKNYVIRFKAPLDGHIEYDDQVFKTVRTPNFENQDFIIIRSDGQAMYNFGATIDDHLMEITHIIRGREHMVNANCQLMLYQAFGWEPPIQGHLPLILSQSGSKLSKRDGAASVFQFRDLGYTPQALLNIVARLGFGYKDQELFSINELIEKFSLENCVRKDGKFDPVKASVINYEHLKSNTLTPDNVYADHLLPFITARGIDICARRLTSLIPLVRTRARTLLDAATELEPVLRSDISIDQSAVEKILTPEAKTKLSAFNTFLQSVNDWTENNLRTATNDWLTQNGMTIKEIGQPTRCAIYGRTQSPELFQVMGVMGKEVVLNRIQKQLI